MLGECLSVHIMFISFLFWFTYYVLQYSLCNNKDLPGLSCDNEQIFCDLLFVNNDSDTESAGELFSDFEDSTRSFSVDPFINEGFHRKNCAVCEPTKRQSEYMSKERDVDYVFARVL